jgi:very-short-patch-repair endonuclease
MKKTLSLRDPGERKSAPLQRKGRGWTIASSRLDTLHDHAREMRRNPTEAQKLLSERFAKADLGHYRFRRQVVIGSAIVDFACQPLGLAIQIDDERETDPAIARRRDNSLAEVGIHLLRFPDSAVRDDIDAVLAEILAAMKARWREKRAAPRSTIHQSQRPQRPHSATRGSDRPRYER